MLEERSDGSQHSLLCYLHLLELIKLNIEHQILIFKFQAEYSIFKKKVIGGGGGVGGGGGGGGGGGFTWV